MVQFYNINDISLGEPSCSGHIVYPDAQYYSPESAENPVKVIFKKNKHGNSQLSRLEVAFARLARLFLPENSTPMQHLVVDDSGTIVGTVVQHLCYVVAQKEGLAHSFYTFKQPEEDCALESITVDSAENIPLYFLNKLPPCFFNQLLEAQKQGHISIDYYSLASIFTASFALEEDDLHKGNFGFYLVEKEGKPRAVFFKIDHDLMFANSIMSFYNPRFLHLVQDEHAFDISADDLLRFPDIKDSANYYWPTRRAFLTNPWSNKGYHYSKELAAFAQLNGIAEFNRGTWLSYYKDILFPQELFVACLFDCFDEHNPIDRADRALITQELVARQAHLRSVLFSIKEFRLFVSTLSWEEQNFLSSIVPVGSSYHQYVTSELLHHRRLCTKNNEFRDGDTPLHVAIRLGDYRYDESIQKYGQWINQVNNDGKTPLELAVEKAQSSVVNPTDVRKDARFTMRHLLEHGAEPTRAFNLLYQRVQIESCQFYTDYLSRVKDVRTYQQFKLVLRDIGENSSFCLKARKELAVTCIASFINLNQHRPNFHNMLIQLKRDINGVSSEADCAGVKYIRQLRSRLWIIRKIRGLYGWSSTQSEINMMVNEQLDKVQEKTANGLSFFSSSPLVRYTLEGVFDDEQALKYAPGC